MIQKPDTKAYKGRILCVDIINSFRTVVTVCCIINSELGSENIDTYKTTFVYYLNGKNISLLIHINIYIVY
jgi:hypothetical protein